MTSPDMRAEFEAWARSEGIEPQLWIPHQPQCGYDNPRVQDYWTGYQAAWNRRTPAVAELSEERINQLAIRHLSADEFSINGSIAFARAILAEAAKGKL